MDYLDRAVSEFRVFVLRGNVIDLAVAVVLGTVFADVVQSLANDVLLNFIAAFAGRPRFSELALSLGDAQILYGRFIGQVVNFSLILVAMFPVFRTLAALQGAEEAKTRKCPECLTAIPRMASRCAACGQSVDQRGGAIS